MCVRCVKRGEEQNKQDLLQRKLRYNEETSQDLYNVWPKQEKSMWAFLKDVAAFVEQCRRYTLFQILKKDSELTTPYCSSQLCSGRPLEIRTRDVLVKNIVDGEKDVACRPAYPSLNNIAPGTKIRFCSQKLSCDKVVVKIERFATFYEGLQHAGMDRCLPGFCGGVSDAVQAILFLTTLWVPYSGAKIGGCSSVSCRYNRV